MDVAVEHGDRAEFFQVAQRLRAVLRAPAPVRIDGPKRNVRKHDDRLRGRAAFDVVFEPRELLAAEIAEAAGFQIDDVDEADEVHAVGIEAVPAGALGAASVAVAIELALVFVEQVVLAGHVVHVEAGLRDDAVGIIEFRQASTDARCRRCES